jgi:hypothetical protein
MATETLTRLGARCWNENLNGESMATDRRAALEAAFDELEAGDDETQDTGSATGEETGNIVDEPVIESDSAEATPADEGEPKPSEKSRERGKDGKFLPAAGDKSASDEKQQVSSDRKAEGQVQKPAVEGQQPAPSVRAPAGWRPELREKFASLPKEVQEEVNRRETEISVAMRQNAGTKQFAEGFARILQPYEAMIRSEGGNYHSAVDSLIKTAYHLRTAPPPQKAMMVAQMIQQHGVDLEMLDNALSQIVQGKQAQVRQDPAFQYMQRELEPIKQFVTNLQSRQQELDQRTGQELMTELQTFAADPKNEFFEDVREVMADLIEASAQRGAKLSLQDAYTRATLAHPTISGLVANRRVTASAAQRSAAARRARNASASLPSGAAPAGAADTGKLKDRRAQLEAAWDQEETRE